MKTEKYILALDQGTTSSRAILFNHGGEIVASAQKEFEQIYPKPGWVEHNPMEIWASQSATVTEALMRHNIDSNEIAGVGITNQRETTIVWDKQTGKPVYNAIVWQDRRTAGFCRKLQEDGIEAMVTEKTGLRLDPYFSATKLAWILDNVPNARCRAENGELLFGTVDTWLLWKLTGHKVHATDITNASRTLLMNLTTGDWDDSLLELFRIPRCILPEIRSCSEVYGHVDSSLSCAEAPIAGIAGDQHSALFGQACFTEGMAKNTYGTGCFLLMNTGKQPIRSQQNLLTTVAWRIGGQTEYALEGSVFIGGAVVQWLRDELQLVRNAAELNALAASVPNSNGLFLVPAFAGLGAPHWDPYARGAMLGITRGTNRAHICRAALESIAFQSADLISAMQQDSGIKLKELRVDGGASRSVPLLQFQSDLLQTRVVRPKNIESTATGAAYLAGLAVGFWKNRKEIAAHWSADGQFKPQHDAYAMQPLRDGWSKAVGRAKAWVEET
ncbi:MULTISPECIES: glycerol kinase GlpK [unclassified Lentimonas]|uniref:glycerol kinase GlpK n=1 Tax=unclassified Lentimonas TaxID=2630993 RepID=UPI00132BDE6C|nr:MULTISPECIES: glycerol kinase GlpK [unclassified Lentimonas]CAA6689746.1 Glycerol kinase (EC [Lentimonas sp. CC19]CAA6690634.1 Glycerol kinase (EC [Lentimonas sp. CC10]CAA7068889.1 Glycerol kinase (EC [Lentimonas sp. CC11]